MQGIPINKSFIPIIETTFGKKNVLVVKYAQDGKSIRQWDTNYKSTREELNLYDRLLNKIDAKIKNDSTQTVTFIWMQGESDAKKQLGDTYEKSLIHLYNRLSADLKKEDIHFILGRLNDFDMNNENFPHWTMIRDIQMKVASSHPKFDWVNTDDLNDGVNRNGTILNNDLHMSEKGYEILGKLFAEKAILVIENNQ